MKRFYRSVMVALLDFFAFSARFLLLFGRLVATYSSAL